jgi:hypothetical protein
MPDSVLMPAPVRTTARRTPCKISVSRLIGELKDLWVYLAETMRRGSKSCDRRAPERRISRAPDPGKGLFSLAS